MSKKRSILYLAVLACTVFIAVTVATADLGAFAQNTNSSTTEDPSMMQNTNANEAPRPRGRRRRGRRRPAPRPAADATMTDAAAENTSTAGDTQPDLSGTYTGKIKMTGSHEMEGDGTITISGNNVTIDAGGMTHTGRIFAVTTRGYTGVTMAFPDIKDTATDTNLIVMARARKRGDRLWLTPVPGARNVIAFR